MEGIWNKFHPLFGPGLKVGFETTFLRGTVLTLDQRYKESGLIHEKENEPIKRIYEPALKVIGCCKDGQGAQVFFEPVSPVESLFRRLVFSRKIHPRKPHPWTVAARHDEDYDFGFDSVGSWGTKYLSLAYPGQSLEFIPVYFKIENCHDFVYLEVWAWDEGNKIVVQGRRVSENETPKPLVSAKPDLP